MRADAGEDGFSEIGLARGRVTPRRVCFLKTKPKKTPPSYPTTSRPSSHSTMIFDVEGHNMSSPFYVFI